MDYLTYKNLLNDDERKFVEEIIRHRTLETNAGVNMVYAKWKYGVVNLGKYSLIEITNEEVGKAITEARESRCITRTQIAGILGISYNTLKMYEAGKELFRLIFITC